MAETVEEIKLRLSAELDPLEKLIREGKDLGKIIDDLTISGREHTKSYQSMAQQYRNINTVITETIAKRKTLLSTERAGNLNTKQMIEVSKSWDKALVEDKKRSEQEKYNAQKKYIDMQIANINRLANEEKKRIAEINNKAITNLNNATKQNYSNQKTDSKFTGQSIVLGSNQALSQMQAYRNTLSHIDPMYKTLTLRMNEWKKAHQTATKSNVFGLLEMGENITIIAQGIMSVLMPAMNKLYSSLKSGSEFGVIRSNFIGTEKDIESFRKAVAGTVSDAGLIKLSNQASDLSIPLREQTILFAMAENAADKYGGSVEENFQKIVFASEGNIRGLRLLGIEKGKYEELVKTMAGAYGKEIDALNATTQKNIRLQAIIKLGGLTYEQATNKIKDNKDMIDAAIVSLDNIRDSFGSAFSDALRNQVDKVSESVGKLKVNTKDAGINSLSMGDALGRTAGFIFKFGSVLGLVINTLPKFIDGMKKIKDAVSKVHDVFRNPVSNAFTNSIVKVLAWAKEELHAFLKLLNLLKAQTSEQDKPWAQGEDSNKKGYESKGLTEEELELEKKKKEVKSGSNKTGKDELEKEKEKLRLIDIENENLIAKQKQLEANKKDLGAERDIMKEILEIQERIYYLKTGNVLVDPYTLPSARTKTRKGHIFEELTQSETTRDEFMAGVYKKMKEEEDMKLSLAGQVKDKFFKMLEITGLMKGDFGDMMSLIKDVIDGVGSGIDFIDTILSFIPGGGMFAGMANAGGMNFNSSLPNINSGNSITPKFNIKVENYNEMDIAKQTDVYINGKKMTEGRPGDY